MLPGNYLSALAGLFLCAPLAAVELLPPEANLDPDIPAPADVLGYDTGDRHPRPHQVVEYLETLAAASDRIHLETIGTSHGGRELVLAYFADHADAERIEALRVGRHQASRDGDGKLVLWLGYNVHGNEASGTPAALMTAYYLAAARSERVGNLLDEAVVIMEPVINPDGLARFANWANNHRGRRPSADPLDREHREAWPNGRTNYYWFDLNRDWLPLVHPESRARLEHYHRWRPHLVTDVHEMGHRASYFFQPGVPERTNPLTPVANQELTRELARFHADSLDARGEAYYTRESFDDYYIGKGSTFPDVTGGVGVLFEQGSTRGHRIETPEGERSYRDAIANQVATSLSSLHGAVALADDFRAYQAEFFGSAGEDADFAGWVIGDGGDPARAAALLDRLIRHRIRVYPADEAVEVNDHAAGRAWVIPADQDHYRLARAMLDPVREFPSKVFYDVSTWWMPAAFDLPVERVRRLPGMADAPLEAPPEPAGSLPGAGPVWVIDWNQVAAPAALHDLLAAGAAVRVATRPTTLDIPGRGAVEFARGSLILPTGEDQPDLREILAPAVEQGLKVRAARAGLAVAGADPGSPSMAPLKPARPLLLTGFGVSPYAAGEIWHWFDTELAASITLVDWLQLYEADLTDYTHVIVPDGEYALIPDWVLGQLKLFVEGGGTLVAIQRGTDLAGRIGFEPPLIPGADEGAPADKNDGNDEGADGQRDDWRIYGEYERVFARRWIGGAILALELDATHPLAYGYDDNPVPVFRQGMTRIPPPDDPYAAPGRYAGEPVMSGYLSELRTEQLAGAPGLTVDHRGRGQVIRIADDYLFRGFFAGTWRLFANVIFFSQVIEPRQLPE